MIILVDMDEVIADFQAGIEQRWAELYPDEALFPDGDRSHFYIGYNQPADVGVRVHKIISSEGFFEHLSPLPGALEALNNMRDLGHVVFILTSPGVSYPNAASEKYRWVEKHLGKHMLERLVITPAKPIVQGDILIDDRPELEFEEFATWEHVLFERPYNKDVTGKRRINWQNYLEVLPELQ